MKDEREFMPGKLSQRIGQRFSDARPNAATYDVHGVVTKVYADDHLLALAVQDFLRPFRGQPDAAPDIEFYLLTKDSGSAGAPSDYFAGAELLYDWQVLRYSREGQLRYQEVPGAGSIVADLDQGIAVAFVESEIAACTWSVTHVVFFPIWAQLLKTRGIFPVHAAGLERGGKGILFPGKSGCGKSTLSLHLLHNGFRLLGDDTVFVRQAGGGAEMLFFPEEVDVCPETIDLFPTLALARNLADDRWQPKQRVNLNAVKSSKVVEASPVDLLVFPVIAADGVTRCERVNQTEALAELILYAFLFMDPQTSKENFALLAGLVQSVACFRLHMGLDGAALAGTIDEIIAAT
ncbi:MAG: hypothetical protein M0Z32_05450 [Actinomycetota bacterium]|nr:hypothetical protein [Actinomycetota bacterium]MCL6093910.1 hypothetical protein [Actinomycetota bacterium]MDA8167179.1 hypothetical protein [Actinomycetota bacterium]